MGTRQSVTASHTVADSNRSATGTKADRHGQSVEVVRPSLIDAAPLMTPATRLWVSGAVSVTLSLALVGAVLDLPATRGVAVTIFLLIEIAAAPLLLIQRTTSVAWFVLMSITFSLTTTVALGFLMSATHLWYPNAVFVFVALVMASLLVPSILRDYRQVKTSAGSNLSPDSLSTAPCRRLSADTPLLPLTGTDTNPGPAGDGSAITSALSKNTWIATMDDGQTVKISEPTLFGRDPSSRPDEATSGLVTVPDDSRTVSKIHFALTVQKDTLFVTDRGSTNGTTVTTAQGVSRRSEPGQALKVPDGSIVSFGNHWLHIQRDGVAEDLHDGTP